MFELLKIQLRQFSTALNYTSFVNSHEIVFSDYPTISSLESLLKDIYEIDNKNNDYENKPLILKIEKHLRKLKKLE